MLDLVAVHLGDHFTAFIHAVVALEAEQHERRDDQQEQHAHA
jgi:hypothetical protein